MSQEASDQFPVLNKLKSFNDALKKPKFFSDQISFAQRQRSNTVGTIANNDNLNLRNSINDKFFGIDANCQQVVN